MYFKFLSLQQTNAYLLLSLFMRKKTVAETHGASVFACFIYRDYRRSLIRIWKQRLTVGKCPTCVFLVHPTDIILLLSVLKFNQGFIGLSHEKSSISLIKQWHQRERWSKMMNNFNPLENMARSACSKLLFLISFSSIDMLVCEVFDDKSKSR